jgi:hypothetical protein
MMLSHFSVKEDFAREFFMDSFAAKLRPLLGCQIFLDTTYQNGVKCTK